MDSREERLARAISALSRRKILRILTEKETSAKEISTRLGMSVSLTSKHLTLLYDLGIIAVRKQLPFKFYSIKIPEIKQLLTHYDSVVNSKSSIKEESLSRAINAQSRRNILRLLTTSERTVKHISQETKMSVSLTSRHLKMLYDLGFLEVRQQFPYKYYRLKMQELRELLVWYAKVITKL